MGGKTTKLSTVAFHAHHGKVVKV